MKASPDSMITDPVSGFEKPCYLADGSQLKVRKLEMSVSYVNGEVEDDMQLAELIKDCHLAIGESSSRHAAQVMVR